jgi:DNA mismatch endonuclease (patch repair protein)
MDHVTSERRSEIMASIGAKDTAPELVVRRFLHQRGLRYRLHVKKLPGNPDLVFSGRRTAVFVNGCFWHGCPHCRVGRRKVKSNKAYWEHKIARNKERDTRTTDELTAAGWRVFTVWACETRDPAALDRLTKAVAGQPSSGSSPFTASSLGPV